MDNQGELFGMDEVERIEGYINRLEEGYEKRWLSACYRLSGAVREFTVEDVRYHGGEVPRNVEGPIMGEAKKLRIIKVVRYENSVRQSAKGRAIPVYTKGYA